MAFISFFTYLISTFLRMAADWWVGQWSKNAFPELSVSQYIYVYAGIATLFVIFIIIKSVIFGDFSANVAYNVFKQLIWNILKRKMEFFDTTPSGQIVNRCSEDIEMIDQRFPLMFGMCLDFAFLIMGSFIIAGIVTPFVIVIILINFIIFFWAMKKFLRTSTELRRLSQLSISPILSKVSELMNGRVTIRTYNSKDYLLKIWEEYHDLNKNIVFHERMSNIWLHVRVELSIISIVAVSGFLIVFSKNYK